MADEIVKLLKEAEDLARSDANAFGKMDAIVKESFRVADVAHDAKMHLDEIEREFDRITEFNKVDYSFLGLATALQVVRWAIIAHFTKIGELFNSDERLKENDPSILETERKERDAFKEEQGFKRGDRVEEGKYKDWLQILYGKVPYDTSKGTKQFNLNIGGKNHRIKTLGHDPILGWIFGTMNIMTDMMTLNDFRSFKVENGAVTGPDSTISGFRCAYESTQEDKKRLAAAIAAEAIHLGSDKFTKLGLPVPILSSLSESWAQELSSQNYDNLCFQRDFKIVSKSIALQLGISIFINTVIAMVHGLFYKEERDISRELYQVKTRKMLLMSNSISSTSNVLYAGIKVYATGPLAWKNLDIGGLAVTLYRLVSDTRFIYKVKREYVENNFDLLIKGKV